MYSYTSVLGFFTWAPVEMLAVQQWIDSNQLFNSLHESFSQRSNILQFIWFCLALYCVTQTVLNYSLMMPSMPIMVKAYRGPDRITTWYWTFFFFSLQEHPKLCSQTEAKLHNMHLWFTWAKLSAGGIKNDLSSSFLILARQGHQGMVFKYN